MTTLACKSTRYVDLGKPRGRKVVEVYDGGQATREVDLAIYSTYCGSEHLAIACAPTRFPTIPTIMYLHHRGFERGDG